MSIALSATALFLAIASLLWQAFTWHRAGPHLKIEGAVLEKDGAPAAFIVEVSNRGRADAQLLALHLLSLDGSTGVELSKYEWDGRTTRGAKTSVCR